jgi:lia operon protein LiaG
MIMKKMKVFITLTLLALLLRSDLLTAQEYKIPVENNKEGSLTLEGFTGSLPIEGYSGNEIILSANGRRFETPERAKGLKPVYAAGTDNTGLAVYFEKNGNKITLHCLLPITHGAGYKIRVPENFALKIKRDCSESGETVIENIKNEIEFNGCHSINLKNVTGPLVVSTISGRVSVVFNEVSKDKPISLASISGEVDVTLPAKAAVDLEMGTISGGMYTDFEFPVDNKEMRRVGGREIHNKLNGGGTELKLSSISGNIYLRKG